MFEQAVVYDRCTGAELATLVETNHRDLMRLENRVLLQAAAWADAHDPESDSDDYADILKTDGDDSTVEVRRSKAIGILAQPDRALQLILDHRSDPTDQPEPATDHDPNQTEDADEPFDPSTGSGQALLRNVRAGPSTGSGNVRAGWT